MADGRYWVRLDRDVITVSGPDAGAYLQGQLSQDVLGLGEGSSAWSWLLAPTGKVDALLRVSHRPGGGWLLDTDAGWGQAVLARLQKFKLRTKADLALTPATVIGLRGGEWPAGPGLPGGGPAGQEPATREPDTVARPPWPGMAGADIIHLGDGDAGVSVAADVPEMGESAYRAVRMRAGQPRMGAELGEKTIPGETGLVPFTVSFTKGCYTGQELVARIDSRGGNVPRHLCRLLMDRELPAGTELLDAGQPAGTVTSVADLAPSGLGSGWAGLGYVRRGIEVPRTLTGGPDGPEVRVEALPW